MRLQEVLKDRETEISLLEESLKESQERATNREPISTQGHEINGVNPDTTLSPKTLNRFDHIRKTMEGVNGNGTPIETSPSYSEDESLERLNELMLYVYLPLESNLHLVNSSVSSMAQKESHHREVVENLNTQLTQTRRQLDDLTTLSRDQVILQTVLMRITTYTHCKGP